MNHWQPFFHSYEFEVVEVVGVDIAGRVDLEAVVVLVRILEQAVHRVQHLVRHREEPFARHSAIVQALLTLKTMVCGKEQLVRHHEEPFAGHSAIVQALLTLKTLVCGTKDTAVLLGTTSRPLCYQDPPKGVMWHCIPKNQCCGSWSLSFLPDSGSEIVS